MVVLDLPYFCESITTSQSALLGARISFWDIPALLVGRAPPSLLPKAVAAARRRSSSEDSGADQGSGDEASAAPVTVELRLRSSEASGAEKKLRE